jgi:hypothetical protein
VVRAQAALNPTCTAVIGEGEKAAVTADPAALRIAEVNGVQVFSPGDHMRGSPAALRVADYRTRKEAAAKGQYSFETNFSDHRLK